MRALFGPASRPWWLVAAAAPLLAWVWAGAGMGQRLPVREPLTDIAWLALLALAEELVFRGGVHAALRRYAALTRRVLHISAANALASLAFALAHGLAQPALNVLALWPVSLVLGVAYERSGERLALPVALHLWFNLALYAASGWWMRSPAPGA